VQRESSRSRGYCGEEREVKYRASTFWNVGHRVDGGAFFVSTGIQYQDMVRAIRKA
jgi:hypothetical protein